MRKKLNLIRITAVAGASLLGASQSAYAVCDGCVVGAVKASSAAVVTAVGTSGAAITASLNLWFPQLVLAQKSAASQISQIVKETGALQGQTAIALSSAQGVREAERRYQVTNPCLVSAPTQGMAETLRTASVSAGSAGRAFGGAGGAVSLRGGGGGNVSLNKVLDISEGRVQAPSPETTAVLAAGAACGSFVTSGPRAEACRAARLSVGNANGHPNADISAATLLDGPQGSPDAPRKRFTIDMEKDSAEEKAVAAFMRNLNTPLELRALTQAELASEAGRRYLAVKDSYEGRMSLADAANKRQAASMAADKSTLAILNDLRRSDGGDAAFVDKYLAVNAPRWQSKGISADELMNLEVERRYMNLNWMKQTAGDSPEAIAREQLRVSALQNVLLWRLNQEARFNGILMGAILGSQVRQESMGELRAAHRAATR